MGLAPGLRWIVIVMLMSSGLAAPALADDDRVARVACRMDADCAPPAAAPTVATDGSPGERELLALQPAVRAYDASATVYARCVNALALAAAEALPAQDPGRPAIEAERLRRVTPVLDGAAATVAAFNSAVRVHRRRSQAAAAPAAEPAAARPTAPPAAPAADHPGSTLPQLKRTDQFAQALIKSCYPAESRRLYEQGRIVSDVRVGKDGRAIDVLVPNGTLACLAAAADCVVAALEFEPATLNGEPIESVVRMPINFSLDAPNPAGAMEAPRIASCEDERREAMRACDWARVSGAAGAGATIVVVLDEDGVVLRTRSAVDNRDAGAAVAAQCVLGKLRFTPYRVGGVPAVAEIVWTMTPPAR